MQPFRLVVLGSTAFAVVSMLLPFASFPVVGPVDGITADAWPALLPLLMVALLAMLGRWDAGLGTTTGITAVVAAGTSLVFSVVKLTDAVLASRAAAGATLGPGAFVLLLAVLGATVAAATGALARR